jgi:hypothetical protein
MNREFVKQFAAEVATVFPFDAHESFDDYCARARQENIGCRALIAACMCEASKKLQAERQKQKTAWISAARLRFDPGVRRPCAVCNKYEGLVEAHHVVPLTLQFDAGASMPFQQHEWLCPTHHAAQHVFIADLVANQSRHIAGLPPNEADTLHQLGVRFVKLFTTLPSWQAVRRAS